VSNHAREPEGTVSGAAPGATERRTPEHGHVAAWLAVVSTARDTRDLPARTLL